MCFSELQWFGQEKAFILSVGTYELTEILAPLSSLIVRKPSLAMGSPLHTPILAIHLFTYEIENNGVLPFLDTLVSRTEEGFSTSVYHNHFAVSLPPHSHSCHPPSQKMAAFYTFVNRADIKIGIYHCDRNS